MNHRGIVIIGLGDHRTPLIAPRVCAPCLFAVHDKPMPPPEIPVLESNPLISESFKQQLVDAVSRDIAFMKQSLMGDGGRAARRARRSKQSWLRRLNTGG